MEKRMFIELMEELRELEERAVESYADDIEHFSDIRIKDVLTKICEDEKEHVRIAEEILALLKSVKVLQ